MDKPPPIISVLYYLLMVCGAIPASAIFIGPFIDRPITDTLGPFIFGVLLMRLSMGLRKGKELSRQWVVGILILIQVQSAFIVGLMMLVLVESRGSQVWWALLPFAVLQFFLLGFARKKVQAPRVTEWIDSRKRFLEVRQPLRFSVSALLFATFLVALVCALHRTEFNYRPSSSVTTTLTSSNGTAMCAYGVQKHRRDASLDIVEYIVFDINTGPGGVVISVRSSYSSSNPGSVSRLTIPEGKVIDLPGENQLHEIKDGKYRTIPGRVTLPQLEAYQQQLSEKRGVPSIDDLLATPVPKED